MLVNLRKFNVVIADDDCRDQALFSLALQASFSKVGVDCVRNGEQLLRRLSAGHQPGDPTAADIVFLDLRMPGMEGLAPLMTSNGRDLFARLPVFVLSTGENEEAINQAMQLGAKGFYTKPESFDGLKKVVSETCLRCLY